MSTDEEIYVLQVKNWTFRDMDGHVGFTRDWEFALAWAQVKEEDHRDYRVVTKIREYR
jgi:hypothetical protein